MEKKVYVFNKRLFDKYMREHNIPHILSSNSNEIAYISISEPGECSHWFENGQQNVLNIDFWDVNDYDIDGIKGLTNEQAQTIYEFIENKTKDNPYITFYVHCQAGYSRSQAIAEFLQDCYGYKIERVVTGMGFPNSHVLRLLKRLYYKEL